MWLDVRQKNRHWQFQELSYGYFNDLHIEEGFDKALAAELLNVAEIAAADEFHKLFRSYVPPKGDFFNHVAILNDPAWQAVVKAAGFARDRLTSMLSEVRELEALSGADARAQAERDSQNLV